MNLSAAIYAIKWLVRDTFRQARASGISWVMLAVSALCILFCLGVSVRGTTSLDHWTVQSGDVTLERGVGESGIVVNGGTVTLSDGTVLLPGSPAVTRRRRSQHTQVSCSRSSPSWRRRRLRPGLCR